MVNGGKCQSSCLSSRLAMCMHIYTCTFHLQVKQCPQWLNWASLLLCCWWWWGTVVLALPPPLLMGWMLWAGKNFFGGGFVRGGGGGKKYTCMYASQFMPLPTFHFAPLWFRLPFNNYLSEMLFTRQYYTVVVQCHKFTNLDFWLSWIQVWYFVSKNQPSLQCSDPLKSSGSHSLFVSDSVGITSSCSILVFLLSVSLASSRLHCLCFSVSILNL